MALLHERDPRWVVEDRADGQNVGKWHWTERDCTKWAKAELKALVCDLALDESGAVKTSKDFQHFEGEVLCFNRKGKSSMVWNIELRLGWEGELKDASGTTVTKGKGKLSVYELSEEALEDGLDITVEFDGNGKGDTDQLRAIVKNGSAARLAEQGEIFKGLLQGHLAELLGGGGARAAGTPAPAPEPAAERAALTPEEIQAAKDAEARAEEAKAAAAAEAKAAEEAAAAAAAAAEDEAARAHKESLGSVFADIVSGNFAEIGRWELSSCGLEDDDVVEVVTAMCKSEVVEEVDLTGNCLTDAACQKLCVGLAGGAAAQLKTVKLGGNDGITEAGRNMFTGLKMMRAKNDFDVTFDS
eukprot:COSAG02_NODE_3782_length_6235_cov_21.044817_3_plen_357_part_00